MASRAPPAWSTDWNRCFLPALGSHPPPGPDLDLGLLASEWGDDIVLSWKPFSL